MIGIRRESERLQSKIHSPVDSKCTIAANDSDELSGYIRIYPMAPADQSILRKVGLELSYQKRRGEVMRFTLHLSNK